MTQLAGMQRTTRDADRQRMASLYEPIRDELEQVERLLQRELTSADPRVDELIKYGFRISGKRLRPALLLLAGQAVGEINDEHIVLAAVVEMIHTATLVHDDVLDEAEIRRHIDTVNARWNNESSVLLGDYLFTHAFYLASTTESTFACRTIGRATNRVCEGELRQVHSSGNLELREAEYLEIIEAKTAELTACCCRLGAHYAGADEDVVDRMDDYGRSLGLAFQIVDDMLDVTGDEASTGKSLGTDLDKQKATLPLIHLLRVVDADARHEILETLNHRNGEAGDLLRGWLERYEALDYARAKARGYASHAAAQLAGLADSPALNVLAGLTRFVLARST